MNRWCGARAGSLGVLVAAISAIFFVSPSAPRQSAYGGAAVRQPRQRQTRTFVPGEVNLASSRVYVFVGKTGLGHEHAVVGHIKKGTVQLGAQRGAGQIVFDMTTFRADTEDARKFLGLSGTTDDSTRQKVNANMLGSSVLDVQRYPTATFDIDSSQRLENKSKRGFPQYRLNGRFTLHGASQPVSIVASAEPKSGWLHLRGGFAILQTDYGITPFSKAFGAIGVSDQLKIWGDIWVAGPPESTAAVPAARTR